jgi:DNA-binding NarL/FixJ family response regulator
MPCDGVLLYPPDLAAARVNIASTDTCLEGRHRVATLDLERTYAGNGLRVLIADRDPLARRELRDSLKDLDEVEVVGEAADGFQAVAAARESQPDVALVEMDLPRLGGIATMRRMRTESPHTRVIQVSATDDDELAVLVLLAGSSGFLVKGMDLGRMAEIVRGVCADEAAVSRRLTGRLLERLRLVSEEAQAQTPEEAVLGGGES